MEEFVSEGEVSVFSKISLLGDDVSTDDFSSEDCVKLVVMNGFVGLVLRSGKGGDCSPMTGEVTVSECLLTGVFTTGCVASTLSNFFNRSLTLLEYGAGNVGAVGGRSLGLGGVETNF